MKILGKLAVVFVGLGIVSLAQADLTVFTDRGAWENAVGAPIITEDFDAIPNTGFLPLNTTTTVGLIDVFPFAGGGDIFRVINGHVDGQVDRAGMPSVPEGFSIIFPSDVFAFGADFLDACSAARLTIQVNAETIPLSAYLDGLCNGFLGFISTEPFSSITFGQELGDCCNEVFQMDNVSFAVIEPITTVTIDIKPGSNPNCFNVNGRGVIPVAVLGGDSFDVTNVDQATLLFGGLEVRVRGNKGPLCSLEDSNGDGFLDIVCQFEDNSDYWTPGDGDATLTGKLYDETEFEGTDSICIVP